MPTFYWGKPLLPGFAEYYSHQLYYDFWFGLPYWIAAIIATGTGWNVTRRVPGGGSIRIGIATLIALMTVALLSDLGCVLHVWTGTRFFLYGGWGLSAVVALMKVFVPPTMFAVLTHRFAAARKMERAKSPAP